MEEPNVKKRRVCRLNDPIHKRFDTEKTGNGCKYLSQAEKHSIERYGEQMQALEVHSEAAQIVAIVTSMENYLRCKSCDVEPLYQSFKTLYECVTCLERGRVNEPPSFYRRENANAQLFYKLGGLEAARDIILLESHLPPSSRHRQESDEKLRMKAVLFSALSRTITADGVGEQIARELADGDEMLIQLFTYLKNDQTYVPACALLEDVLQYHSDLVLCDIPNLEELILDLDDDKFSHFCRVVAIVVSDRELYVKQSCSFSSLKKDLKENVRELNQDFLLGIPYFIQRLVAVVTSTEDLPRFKGLRVEQAQWMQLVDNASCDDIFDLAEEDVDAEDFIGGLMQPTEYGSPWCLQPSVKIINSIIDKSEAVHVLGLLLAGKHRQRAQTVLASAKLIAGLSDTFENLIWVFQGTTWEPWAGDNSPEHVFKIQIMKLIHSLCGHSEYKHLLLTRTELAELQRINERAGPLAIEGLDNMNRANMCKGKDGLLTKVVEILKREPVSFSQRIWLVKVVYNYLRGPPLYCSQVFLLRRGLVQHVINSLMADDSNRKEVFQSGFDLLAELTKFNIETFRVIDDILRVPETKNKFVALINRNLVDSHVFIRSLILSHAFFCNEQTEHAEYARNGSYLLSYIGNFQQQLNYLHKLLNLTTAQSVSQENIGCLNTALLLVMCNCLTGHYAPYLQALGQEQITYTSERRGGSAVLNNFRELLVFWRGHYVSRVAASETLESSTRLPFTHWRHVVDVLTSDDVTLPTSITYYTETLPD